MDIFQDLRYVMRVLESTPSEADRIAARDKIHTIYAYWHDNKPRHVLADELAEVAKVMSTQQNFYSMNRVNAAVEMLRNTTSEK